MGIDLKAEQRYFWKRYEEILTEQGNPFTIHYMLSGSVRAQGIIDKEYSPHAEAVLEVSFLARNHKLRIDLYVRDNLPLWDDLCRQKEQINRELQENVEWTTKGDRNPNTRRIQMFLPLRAYERNTYDDKIKQSIEIVKKWKEVLPRYVNDLFDV